MSRHREAGGSSASLIACNREKRGVLPATLSGHRCARSFDTEAGSGYF